MDTWHRQIKTIFNNANNTHHNITFTYETSIALPFIDVLIKTNNTYTAVHCKPTDRHSYLHYKGNHPIHLKHSIMFKIFSCCKRMCSDHRDFIKCSKELTHLCYIKGFPMTITNKQWQEVVNIQTVNLLKYKEIKHTATSTGNKTCKNRNAKSQHYHYRHSYQHCWNKPYCQSRKQ